MSTTTGRARFEPKAGFRHGLFGRILDDVDDLAFGDAADLIELKAALALEIFRGSVGRKNA